MKRIFLFNFIFFLFISNSISQEFLQLDLVKMNSLIKSKSYLGYQLDSLTIYGGSISGSLKDSLSNEIILDFAPNTLFKEIKNEKKELITEYQFNNYNAIYFENEYISVLYIQLPKYNLTVSLTTYLAPKNFIETLFNEINPEEVLEKAQIKKN